MGGLRRVCSRAGAAVGLSANAITSQATNSPIAHGLDAVFMAGQRTWPAAKLNVTVWPRKSNG